MEKPSRQLAARADAIAQASVEPMYQDPFWEARYGPERARRFGDEDARFHVRYLVQSLDEQRPSVMEGYARWLRTLLVSRGMSTFHLDANFAGLASALEAEGWGPGTEPYEHVRAAREALRYPEGPSRTLQDDAAELSRAATARLALYLTQEDRPRLEEELRLQLSYLADALDADKPELMADHVRWYVGFWPRRGFGLLAFPTVLGMLKAVLGGRHPQARALLATAGVSWEETRS
ncbi:hypothetical protein OWM54_19855 [Myxococcus sp. MISCRS1]|jgi:hypothetical protein|uniref:hypothetical protein n=1 Tax=Myxococcus TaxID=32 RepID=UPI0011439305|nr:MULTISPECIES: hypothetical protein [Myxococcus]BDT30603.1 hypothetical protein MFMH1_02720 [Myxococcus sp. MH1]MBZ4395250.1 hypothetical protein [Myxococcus sp. AS-1-15]MBZ4414484.1 hypothetical protein [Myxococcus sp. XM-1-1-1]MCK8501467.1 hypothetical protein [Myxococcus fulvus]MCY0999394.1 hypothetical protein [Myxococcus sp. MISCRS1]